MKHCLSRGCSIHPACLWAEKGRWRAVLGQARDASTAPLSLLPSWSWGYNESQSATATPFPVLFPHGGCTTAKAPAPPAGFSQTPQLGHSPEFPMGTVSGLFPSSGHPKSHPLEFPALAANQHSTSSQFSIPARPDLFKRGCLDDLVYIGHPA